MALHDDAGHGEDGLVLTLRRSVVFRPYVTESVLLDASSGEYHGIDPDGGRMLEAVLSSPTVSAAADKLVREGFGTRDEVVRDVRALCEHLEGLGLLEPRSRSSRRFTRR